MTIKSIYSDLLFCFNKRPVSSVLGRPTEPTQTENTHSDCKLIIETQQTLQESGSSFLKKICFLAKADMVKQYSSATVVFRAHSGSSCSGANGKSGLHLPAGPDILRTRYAWPCLPSWEQLLAVHCELVKLRESFFFFLKAHHCFSFFKW